MRESLNERVAGLPQSATLAINAQCNTLLNAGRKVYKLGLGQSPFPVPEHVVDALRLHAAEKDYLPVEGLPALRRAVAKFHRAKDGVVVRPEDVIVGPGSKELLFLLNLVFDGDIIVPAPCWVSYVPQARIIGRDVHLLTTDGTDRWRLNAGKLDQHLKDTAERDRARLMILNYPGNPDGLTYDVGELAQIAEVARRHKVLLLSDEIYGQLHHRGEHTSVARYYPEGTIISGGLSKWCGAGGWRLGTFAFPKDLHWLLNAMAAVASETYTSVSAPIQYAAVAAFEGGAHMEHYLVHCRRILSALGGRCASMLSDAGVDVHEPIGGFYLFLDFSPLRERLAARGIRGGRELAHALLDDTGVAILPGADFQRPDGEFTARLAYVDFDGSRAMAASELIALDEPLPDGFVDIHCAGMMDAMRLIADWLKE